MIRVKVSVTTTPQLDTPTVFLPLLCGAAAPASFSACITASSQPEGEPSPAPWARETSWKQHLCWKHSAGEEQGFAGNVVPPAVSGMVLVEAGTLQAPGVPRAGDEGLFPCGEVLQEKAEMSVLAQSFEMATQTQGRIPRAGSSQVCCSLARLLQGSVVPDFVEQFPQGMARQQATSSCLHCTASYLLINSQNKPGFPETTEAEAGQNPADGKCSWLVNIEQSKILQGGFLNERLSSGRGRRCLLHVLYTACGGASWRDEAITILHCLKSGWQS